MTGWTKRALRIQSLKNPTQNITTKCQRIIKYGRTSHAVTSADSFRNFLFGICLSLARQGHTELVILYIGSLTPMKCTQGRSSCGHGTRREGRGPIYRADLCSNEIAEPVEPLDVRLEVACLLHVFERRLNVGVLLGEGLHEFLGSDERQPLQLDVRQLLRQHQRTGTHFGNVGLKRNTN